MEKEEADSAEIGADSVANIMTTLEDNPGDELTDTGNEMSQDEYAMYVTDDEAMAVALDAAEEATADTSSVSHTEEGEEGVPTKEHEAAANKQVYPLNDYYFELFLAIMLLIRFLGTYCSAGAGFF